MRFEVRLTSEAEMDLADIFGYVVVNDGLEQAEILLARIKTAVASLTSLPKRGNRPPELARLSISDFREIHESPYRIIYQLCGDVVYIHSVLDARRNIKDILEQ